MSKNNWEERPDSPSIGMDPRAVHATRPDDPRFHAQGTVTRKVVRGTLGALVKAGDISLEDAIDELAAFKDLAAQPEQVDPDSPYGPERPDQQFSRGRRGEYSANNRGYPEDWMSRGWQRAATVASGFIARGLAPVYSGPADTSTDPTGGLDTRFAGERKANFLTYSSDGRPSYPSKAPGREFPTVRRII